MQTKNVLCICTGNYSRSPIAAAILRREAEKHGDDWRIKSAGTTDWGEGREPAPCVLNTIHRLVGEPAPEFVPHKATQEEVAWANVILVMEFEHVAFFYAHYLQYAYKVMLISELLGVRENILNPHHEDVGALWEVALTLERYIVGGYPVLQRRLGESAE